MTCIQLYNSFHVDYVHILHHLSQRNYRISRIPIGQKAYDNYHPYHPFVTLGRHVYKQ